MTGIPSLADLQLEFLRRAAALDPAPCVMGGYAVDALLSGHVTRPHEDIDWLVPRRQLGLRLAQAAELGFDGFETWGESAPGEPLYLFGENGDLKLDMGILDEEEGRLLIKVHKLMFDIGGREAPAGYQIVMPVGTLDHPPVEIEGISIRVASPLAIYHMLRGIATQGSFGEVPAHKADEAEQLRLRFFPGRSNDELSPGIEPLPGGGD